MDSKESSSQPNLHCENGRPWLIAFGGIEIAIACGLLLIAALLFFALPRMWPIVASLLGRTMTSWLQ